VITVAKYNGFKRIQYRDLQHQKYCNKGVVKSVEL
jgi:hypothetical protein